MNLLWFLVRIFCIFLVLFHPTLSRQTTPARIAAPLGRCGSGKCQPPRSPPPSPAPPISPARK
ncbi:hypothetical protein TIFTF001_024426 [Ficus carica]|uniref:Uncharacterized protein n=1 Tax=Ficus carica TaxID=3494 RepID=A0AA88AVP4_FICCA|nr:hypothetical protein TIFTF001_024426 [Ficus carica]